MRRALFIVRRGLFPYLLEMSSSTGPARDDVPSLQDVFDEFDELRVRCRRVHDSMIPELSGA